MAAIKCNGLLVFEATITRPAYGRWVARLKVDSKTKLTGAVTLSTLSVALKGTVDDTLSGVETNTAELVVHGGTGGITKTVEPRDYVNVTVGVVLADLAQDCGETLSSTIAKELLVTPITRWTRLRGNAGAELKALLDATLPGKRWRILEDGTLWIGEHAWAESAFLYTPLGRSSASGENTIAVEKLSLLPGVTFEGERVYQVHDDFSKSALRHRYNTRKPSADAERDHIAAQVGSTVDTLRLFTAKVLAPSTLGGALELKPDDPRFPPMSKVPVRTGIPGVKVRVPKDARVSLMFENGDRRKPIALAWEQGSVDEVSFDGGTKSAARADDIADAGTLIVVPGPSGVSAITYVEPGGGVTVPSGGTTIALKAKLADNKSKLKV